MDWGNLFGNTASGALAGSSLGPWGALAGGGIGLVGSLLGGSPGEKAQEQTQKGWQQSQDFQKPFVEHGNAQYDRLNQAGIDLQNPEAPQNAWASRYQSSPYANYLLSQNQARGMDAASQYGLGGSSAAIGNIQQGAGNIVNEQRQQYMDDLMNKYMSGIGLGQSLYGTGAEAAGKLGEQSVGNGLVNAVMSYNRADQPLQNIALGGANLLNSYNKSPTQFKNNWSGIFS